MLKNYENKIFEISTLCWHRYNFFSGGHSGHSTGHSSEDLRSCSGSTTLLLPAPNRSRSFSKEETKFKETGLDDIEESPTPTHSEEASTPTKSTSSGPEPLFIKRTLKSSSKSVSPSGKEGNYDNWIIFFKEKTKISWNFNEFTLYHATIDFTKLFSSQS